MAGCRQPARLPANPRRAIEELSAADKLLGRAIKQLGPFPLPQRPADLHLLCASIIGQSISMKAADSIVARFTERAGPRVSLTPERVLAIPEEELKALGLTWGKANALHGLARVWAEQGWQDDAVLRRSPDDAITSALCTVKGIGPWTAKMFLMFGLRRPDVLPQEDLGVREGLRLLDGAAERPSPKEVVARAVAWRPWRTVASVYLWQVVAKDREQSLEGGGWW
jgi:methylated-DNA-[protein]-cysteine S-methyltransferase